MGIIVRSITELAKSPPILCLDLDGVVHAYRKGWHDGTLYDDVTPGFWEWAAEAQKHFQLVIHSSRCVTEEGADAVADWLEKHYLRALNERKGKWRYVDIAICTHKPPAFLTIDDRAVIFQGHWKAVDPSVLLSFKPWWEVAPGKSVEAAGLTEGVDITGGIGVNLDGGRTVVLDVKIFGFGTPGMKHLYLEERDIKPLVEQLMAALRDTKAVVSGVVEGHAPPGERLQ